MSENESELRKLILPRILENGIHTVFCSLSDSNKRKNALHSIALGGCTLKFDARYFPSADVRVVGCAYTVCWLSSFCFRLETLLFAVHGETFADVLSFYFVIFLGNLHFQIT